MLVRNLVTAVAVSVLLVGAGGPVPAQAVAPAPGSDAGAIVTWGDLSSDDAAAAMAVPGDLSGPVRSVATTAQATGAVTLDGVLRVWGTPDAPEVELAPSDVTDATAVTLNDDNGAVLHADGRVTAWGPGVLSAVPAGLRATAIALQAGTGYAVSVDGTLRVWGDAPAEPLPPVGQLTDLVDVSASALQVLALRADGSVVIWGPSQVPAFNVVPDFGGRKAVEIATGPTSSGVILDDGTISVWGTALPAQQPAFDGLTPAGRVVDLSLAQHGAAVTADGAVHVWGASGAVTGIPETLLGQPVSSIAVAPRHVVAVVTAFRELTTPTVSGVPEVGQVLTATPATFSLTPQTASGQWYADDAPITGSTATTVTITPALVGTSISYRTTATRDDQTLVSSSVALGPVPTVASGTVVSVGAGPTALGGVRTVTASVTSALGVPSGMVTFTVGTAGGTAALVDGKATWRLPALPVGSHSVSAAYSGDASFDASQASPVKVVVTKAASRTSGKVKVTGKTKKAAKRVTLTLSVASVKGVSLKGKVTIKIKGVTKKAVTASVSAAGKAKVVLKNVKRGRFTAKVTYAGNGSVTGSAATVKLKV